ncbi:MAG TPA: biotin/lipoyl-containing protein [Holophagaceae bacterium]|nr:biotin/lipoyl-containing protein [Holophagaceae bacterium]
MKRTLIVGKEQVEVELTHLDGVDTLIWNGEATAVDILEVEPGSYSVIMGNRSVDVRLDAAKHPDPDLHAFRASLYDGAYEFALQDPRKALLAAAGGAGAAGGILTAPMPGKVVKLLVKEGDKVEEGQSLLILEAMKMQNEFKSPSSGVVAKLHVAEGGTVETAQTMVTLGPLEA